MSPGAGDPKNDRARITRSETVSDDILHVVNFSGGLCSFWAAYRVKQQYGAENMVLLFADTLIEDAELYEFNRQASELLGVPVTRVSREVPPWELFRREGLIGNSHFPICSVRLKREPLDEWHLANGRTLAQCSQGAFWDDGKRPLVIYLGFDWTEEHRLAAIRREKPEWRWEAPMQEAPLWDKCRMEREARSLGLIIPKLYGLGFPHNNCGGRCVRAGISHFVHLYHVLPERFFEWEREEAETAQDFRRRGIEPLSVLKDRRGGTATNLWLSELRNRIESGESFPRDEWGGCGCGGATAESTSATRAFGN
jgi:hypothetical protein